MRSKRGVVQQHFEGELLARPSLGHLAVLDLPAGLLQERDARGARCSRTLPVPSVSGSLNSLVKTSSGILPRSGSRIFSSSGDGRPVEASSELPKNELLRV